MSFSYAFQGIVTFFRTQHNAWIHAVAAAAAIAAGFYFQLGKWDWALVTLAIAMVFITEMLNTAVEFLTDLVSPQFHPLAKKAKDVAAASVLFASVAAIVLGAIVFLPKFL
ncbi:MAG: diacylglycerol kinase family protein [Bacteroidia bacterium]